LFEESARKMIY